MSRLIPVFFLVGCLERLELPPETACIEAGYAIGARTEECTGDSELGAARIEAFEAEYDCVNPTLANPSDEVGLFECGLVMRNLACELVTEYGDDLDQWLRSSDACGAITDPVGGGA